MVWRLCCPWSARGGVGRCLSVADTPSLCHPPLALAQVDLALRQHLSKLHHVYDHYCTKIIGKVPYLGYVAWLDMLDTGHLYTEHFHPREARTCSAPSSRQHAGHTIASALMCRPWPRCTTQAQSSASACERTRTRCGVIATNKWRFASSSKL